MFVRNPLHAITGLTEHVSTYVSSSRALLASSSSSPSSHARQLSDSDASSLVRDQQLLHADDLSELSESVSGIISCVRQMRCIVDDVLDLHKIETGKSDVLLRS